jgi:tetratricopeptide (TPR) repeat protein
MMPAKAKLIAAYLDTVQATIIMSDSMEPAHIRQAIGLLNHAHSTFAPSNTLQHTHYALRCQNEIALAYLRLARACADDPKQQEENLREAELHVARVKEHARLNLNMERRTYCSALIAEARIKRERGKPDEALALAEQAKREGSGIELIHTDAWIAAGEAEVDRQAYGKAISAFVEALDSARANRKDAAVCHLHLCRAYLLDNQPAKAKEHFKLWESMKSGIENAFIAALAVKVSKLLFHKVQNFERTRADVQLHGDHKQHLDSLRRWLAETALALDHDEKSKAAQRLGVDVVTLRAWLRL